MTLLESEFGAVLEADVETIGNAWILCSWSCSLAPDIRMAVWKQWCIEIRTQVQELPCHQVRIDKYRVCSIPFLESLCAGLECLRKLKGRENEPGWSIAYRRCFGSIRAGSSDLQLGTVGGEPVDVWTDARRWFFTLGPGGQL